MKEIITPEYQAQLDRLAGLLVTPERFAGVLDAADLALGDTVEFEPIQLAA